jgi:hypothetical protein
MDCHHGTKSMLSWDLNLWQYRPAVKNETVTKIQTFFSKYSCKIIPVTIHQHERALVFPKSHFLEALKEEEKKET